MAEWPAPFPSRYLLAGTTGSRHNVRRGRRALESWQARCGRWGSALCRHGASRGRGPDPVRANERGLTQRYGVENLVAIASVRAALLIVRPSTTGGADAALWPPRGRQREVPSSFLPLVRDALMMQESDALDAKADVRAALVEAASRDKSWFARGEAGQEAPSFDPLPAEEFQDNFVFSKASADALRVHDHGGGGGAAAGARRADGSARGVQKRPRDAAAAGAGSGGTHGATGGHAKRARGSTRRAEPQSGAPEPELSPELREITRELTTKVRLRLRFTPAAPASHTARCAVRRPRRWVTDRPSPPPLPLSLPPSCVCAVRPSAAAGPGDGVSVL